jgi:hypothetical protein
VKGYDPSPEAAVFGQKHGLEIMTGDFTSFSHHQEIFSCVVLKNVLEHVMQPVSFIADISENFLEQGSLIQIEVPNEFSILQSAAVKSNSLEKWWVAPPGHLNYFNLNSLQKILTHLDFEILDAFSSFPLEIFLLMDRDYVSTPSLGRDAHIDRMKFEKCFFQNDMSDELLKLYRGFANMGIGRQITIIGRKK